MSSAELARPLASALAEAGPRRIDGYLPIEQYAVIGDGGTNALVGSDGSIDWLCLPERDSSSVFGSLLDARGGGRFVVQPAVPFTVERSYIPRTNVLQSTFETADGRVRLTDALTLERSAGSPRRELVRRLEGLAGRVPMRCHYEPRFEFGKQRAHFQRQSGALVAREGGLQVALQCFADDEPQASAGVATLDLELAEGETALLALQATSAAPLPLPRREEIERRLAATVDLWRSWVGGHTYEGPWVDAVERSLLALRTLADGVSGAIVAGGTTSLPEALGGERNYDYRFGWVRDLSFTLDAFVSVGIEEPTQASLDWLLRASERTHPRVDPVYSIRGDVVRTQHRIDLPGYRRTRPVNIGNDAGAQLQLGGFGDLIETAWRYVDAGHALSPGAGERLADMADLLCHIWRNADAGLWELGDSAQYTTSKVGCWVALQRAVDLAEGGHVPARHISRWRRERDAVRAFVETRLWSERKRSYLFKADSEALDCGALLSARRGYADPHGDRLNGTIDAIARELSAGGPLLYRYTGMRDEENAFLACSFWMVEALAMAGRVDEAAARMDAMVALANDVGLYSEEMDPASHAMLGNFPQALTHLALINAATYVAQAQSQE